MKIVRRTCYINTLLCYNRPLSSESMPFSNVLPWCCHDIIPVAVLLSRGPWTEGHLTQLFPCCLLAVIENGYVDHDSACLIGIDAARQRLIEDGRTALVLSFCLQLPHHLIPHCDTDLCLAVYVLDNRVLVSLMRSSFPGLPSLLPGAWEWDQSLHTLLAAITYNI